MRVHLESGCSRCGRLSESLARVAHLAQADGPSSPPDVALRSVRAYFSLNQQRRHSWLAEVTLGLSFDSVLHPVSTSIRTESEPPRQLTFGSHEYTLDLTVDPPGGAGEAVVSGYCLRRAGDPVAGAPVFLISRGQFAGQSTTGSLGQFQFNTELADPMEIWLFDEDTLPVALSLNLASAT